ncbi:MAG TPA: hypothetical protein VFL63_02720, partial [Rhodanobacteraceae bacterium]|nr:hypothetical protein [Rhodanobacteraceae bacterium]
MVAFTIVLLLQMSTAAHASTPAGIDPYEEFGKRIQAAQAVAPMSDNAFGDRISLYDGATGFDVTDFSVPGNNALPVSLGRRFQVQSWPKGLDPGNLGGFGEWDLDVPYLEAEVTTQNGWTLSGGSSARCSDTT